MRSPKKERRFLILTGLSGSGKSAVSRFLEDMGYYCVDNLPAKLIPSLVRLWAGRKAEIEKMALVVDIREPSFLKDFPVVLEDIRRKKRVDPWVLFFEASDETLAKRFSESRRPHPIYRAKSVLEGICLERRRLAGIKSMSDEIVDTTHLSIMQLKNLIAGRILGHKNSILRAVLISFGYKFGIPLDADLVFDTRFLPNPFYIDKLRAKNGQTAPVKKFVMENPETRLLLGAVRDFIEKLLPEFRKEGKSQLTIAFGCTGGKHRSVVVAEEMKKILRTLGLSAGLYHRDIFK
ncbi:MAG: RNase adapter RapZ [Acidobacteriota bacterium]|nr:RNase adapter RapZ [Acidobacteriota bacterium]